MWIKGEQETETEEMRKSRRKQEAEVWEEKKVEREGGRKCKERVVGNRAADKRGGEQMRSGEIAKEARRDGWTSKKPQIQKVDHLFMETAHRAPTERRIGRDSMRDERQVDRNKGEVVRICRPAGFPQQF